MMRYTQIHFALLYLRYSTVYGSGWHGRATGDIRRDGTTAIHWDGYAATKWTRCRHDGLYYISAVTDVQCRRGDDCQRRPEFGLRSTTLSITTFQTINLTGSDRSRTLLLLLLLTLLNPRMLLPFSNLSTGLRSANALNINFFLLPTKFLQPVNLAILTIWSLFNPLAVPDPYLLSLFFAHQPSPHWKLQIAHSDNASPRLWNQLPDSFRQPRQ